MGNKQVDQSILSNQGVIREEVFFGLVILLTSLRCLHFGSIIDLPHDWRQSDTAYYIQDFYENGIQLLSPAVCWMGNYEHLALEFPLPEAIVVVVQSILGDSMIVSRSVFLLFFLIGVYFFYKIVDFLFGENLAQWASLIYLLLPLSLFYSRAIHIDFFALAATYGMLYYCLLAMKRQSLSLLAWSSVCAVLAFLVKIPYAFYLALPLLVYAWREQRLKWLLSRAWVFVAPLLAFLWWQQHAYAINHAAPDWEYILSYRKFDHNSHWYFGNIQQRLSLYNWKVISWRMFFEVGGGVGILLAIWGVLPKKAHPKIYFVWWWIIGLGIYLLLFFNLNLFHNYYQLPFLAIMAIAAGFGIIRLAQYGQKWMYIAFGLLAASSITYAEYTYYEEPLELVSMGQTIQENTPDDALVIVTYKNFDCRNPRILYRANRKGWSLEKAAARPLVLEKLHKEEGVNWWAYFDTKPPSDLPMLNTIQQEEILLGLPAPFSDINLYLYQWSEE